jgi:hypothetical protein
VSWKTTIFFVVPMFISALLALTLFDFCYRRGRGIRPLWILMLDLPPNWSGLLLPLWPVFILLLLLMNKPFTEIKLPLLLQMRGGQPILLPHLMTLILLWSLFKLLLLLACFAVLGASLHRSSAGLPCMWIVFQWQSRTIFAFFGRVSRTLTPCCVRDSRCSVDGGQSG